MFPQELVDITVDGMDVRRYLLLKVNGGELNHPCFGC